MHHIYTSDSIILKREPQDMSAYYHILTKDLGLIRARAQGVRGATSRLKGALQEFSFSTIAYVHGKAGWKITTAIPQTNFFIGVKDVEVRIVMAKISDCLIRLIPGEEKSQEIFTSVEKGFTALMDTGADVHSIEAVILSRILYSLGLLAKDANTEQLFVEYSDYSTRVISFASNHKAEIIKSINRGFKESQL